MSPSTGLPPASVPVSWTYSCPAPSAKQITAWPCVARRFLTCSTTPLGPSIAKGTSGMRHTSTDPDANAACMAMKPDWRPMSLTTPTPLSADLASTAAALMAFCASSTAVSKPNVLSMWRMSLSIVFGMPTTETLRPRLAHSALIALAPAWLPLPPITNTMLIPCRSMESTIFGTSPPPRPQPTMEPPRSCTQNATSVITNCPHDAMNKINAPALRWCCAWSAACSWRRPARTRPIRTGSPRCSSRRTQPPGCSPRTEPRR